MSHQTVDDPLLDRKPKTTNTLEDIRKNIPTLITLHRAEEREDRFRKKPGPVRVKNTGIQLSKTGRKTRFTNVNLETKRGSDKLPGLKEMTSAREQAVITVKPPNPAEKSFTTEIPREVMTDLIQETE
jgi:hypothetical protein